MTASPENLNESWTRTVYEVKEVQPVRQERLAQQHCSTTGVYKEGIRRFLMKEELLMMIPLRESGHLQRDKNFLVKRKQTKKTCRWSSGEACIGIERGALAGTGCRAGFIAHCNSNTDIPPFLHYHCIIHQLAIRKRRGSIITLVVRKNHHPL